MNLPTLLLIAALIPTPAATAPASERSMAAVRPGDAIVTGARLKPYHARYVDVVTADGSEQIARRRSVSLEAAHYPGGDGFRRTVAMIGATDTVYDEVQLLRASLSPVKRSVSALSMVHKVEVYGEDGQIRGFAVAGDGTGGQPSELAMEGKRFDGGSVGMILATLPLKKGYSAALATFSSDMGPQRANLTTRIEVTGRDELELAGRTWITWVVESRLIDADGEALRLPDGSAFPVARYWIADEPPYQIRTAWGDAHRVDLIAVVDAE